MLFIEYPKCSTCKKAKKFLEENHQEFIDDQDHPCTQLMSTNEVLNSIHQ